MCELYFVSYILFYAWTTFRGVYKLGIVISGFTPAIFPSPFSLLSQFYFVPLFGVLWAVEQVSFCLCL